MIMIIKNTRRPARRASARGGGGGRRAARDERADPGCGAQEAALPRDDAHPLPLAGCV